MCGGEGALLHEVWGRGVPEDTLCGSISWYHSPCPPLPPLRFRESMAGRPLQGSLPFLITLPHTTVLMYGDWEWRGKEGLIGGGHGRTAVRRSRRCEQGV